MCTFEKGKVAFCCKSSLHILLISKIYDHTLEMFSYAVLFHEVICAFEQRKACSKCQ